MHNCPRRDSLLVNKSVPYHPFTFRHPGIGGWFKCESEHAVRRLKSVGERSYSVDLKLIPVLYAADDICLKSRLR